MKIISVVGARPNFMKIAPVNRAFKELKKQNPGIDVTHLICHTGQHYDEKMSKVFFEDLELPKPDFYLGVGSGSHAEQTARVMVEFEKILLKEKADLIIVVGDVNSTIACSLVAAKMNIKIAHVEAGLRSFDMSMPEEINRILTDRISDYLFVTENSGLENLGKEGVSKEKIHYVGNVMIDSLVHFLPMAEKSGIKSEFKLEGSKYIVVTLHRPANVDSPDFLSQFLELCNNIPEDYKIIFPVHPRTKKNISESGLDKAFGDRIISADPIGYLDFLNLLKDAELVITDSGGIQEETTYLGVQCATLRDNTERPVTIEKGTNWLLGTNLEAAQPEILKILSGRKKNGTVPELWDGRAAERIVNHIINNNHAR